MRKRKQAPAPSRRGYFVDVKTLGGVLLAGNFSLEGLGEALGVVEGKLKTEAHGKKLTASYLKYAMRDTDVTAETFWRLQTRFEQLGLRSLTLESAFSEASVGKAHFRDMNIKPFLEVQRDFPKELLGIALSTFYGGRSEVHIRRTVCRIAYCDFLSMYPTVFVLMGLFKWVTSQGVNWCDATGATRSLLSDLTIDKLLTKTTWSELTILVRVELDDDIFPLRAPYGDPEEDPDSNTIGLNRAKSDGPLWYTLADCVASTILTGKPPTVVEALRFEPREMQEGLKPLSILQNPAFRIDPKTQDFFKRVIELRHATKANAAKAEGATKASLEIEENFLKIVANSTGYGIFAQFIADTLDKKAMTTCYGPAGVGFPVKTSKREKPGDFFHPLLATFITGAARLMLSLAERLAIDAGLDWAFCDTDSMAFVKPNSMPEQAFQLAVQGIIDRFASLNPYDFGGSILKMESENFVEGSDKRNVVHPLYVIPISAKRYAMFNVDDGGRPIIRKASTHGVGQYMSPYADDRAPDAIPPPVYKLKDVKRWEHDLWFVIAEAALTGNLKALDLNVLPRFDKPAACQYTATSYDRWRWFDRFNENQPPEKRVRPSNFLLTFQMKPEAERAPVQIVLGDSDRRVQRPAKRKAVHPVAPYHKDPKTGAKLAFDRETDAPVAVRDLMTYADVFGEYAHHAESKFLNGGPTDSGRTERRLVYIKTKDIVHIGKESNEYEEEPDPERTELVANFGQFPVSTESGDARFAGGTDRLGLRNIADQSGLSRQTVSAIANGRSNPSKATIRKLRQAVIALTEDDKTDAVAIVATAVTMLANGDFSLRELARRAQIDPSNLAKVFSGTRKASKETIEALRTMVRTI